MTAASSSATACCWTTRAERDEHERLEQWARDYGFELALTRPGSGFDRYLSRAPGWRLVRGRTPLRSLGAPVEQPRSRPQVVALSHPRSHD
jgi:hypothetical protein